jgi:hypothetical protein
MRAEFANDTRLLIDSLTNQGFDIELVQFGQGYVKENAKFLRKSKFTMNPSDILYHRGLDIFTKYHEFVDSFIIARKK